MTTRTLESSSRLLRRLLIFVWTILILSSVAAKADPAKTLVQDKLYRANGTAAQGTITIRWNGFSTSAGEAVAAGEMTVATDANGSISIPLIPNTGSNPAGTYYRVVIKLNDGTTSEELWVVPATTNTTISAIRAKMVPQAVAAQFLTRDSLDTALSSFSTTSLVHLTGAETIAGVKTFVSSPEVPTPVDTGAAANKQYVDQQISGLATQIPNLSSPGAIGSTTPGVVSGTNGNFSGSVVVGTSCPATGGTGNVEAQQVNGVLNAACFAGSDASAKIAAALATCTSGASCTVDATELSGAQNWGSTVALTQTGTQLILGCGTYSGGANPMLNIQANNVKVTGCGEGTVLATTGTNGAIGVASMSSGGIIQGLVLRDFSVKSTAASTPYGLFLNGVAMFEIDNVSVDGNAGAMQYGYLLQGVEQGEIHGGAILQSALVNVDFQVGTIGSSRFASGNGVDFHGMSLQNSVTGGKNIVLEANCCDDVQIHNNHLVISSGARENIEVNSTPNHAGPISIVGNHLENYSSAPYALSDPANAWVIKVNGSTGVVIEDNDLDNGPSPYNLVWVTGSATNTRIVRNHVGGIVQIDAGVTQTDFSGNMCRIDGGTTLDDSGDGTSVTGSTGPCNFQDKYYGTSYTNPDIVTFKPRVSSGSPVGSNWGLSVEGKGVAGALVYHKLCAYNSTTDCAWIAKVIGSDYLYIGNPNSQTQWIGLGPNGTNFPGTLSTHGYVLTTATYEGQGANFYNMGGYANNSSSPDYVNYQRLAFSPQSSTNWMIAAQNGGTGAPMALSFYSGGGMPIQFLPGGNNTWYMASDGSLLCHTDGACPIGGASANRPSNLYLSNYLNVNGAFSVNSSGQLYANGYLVSKASLEGQVANFYYVGGYQGGGDYTNYQRLSIGTQSSTNWLITPQSGGTGAAMALSLGSGSGMPLQFMPGGALAWYMNASGGYLLCATDGGCSIGNGALNRPANLYLSNYLSVNGNFTIGATGNWVARGAGSIYSGALLQGYSDAGTTKTYQLNAATGVGQFNGGVQPSATSASIAFFGAGSTDSIGGSALSAGQCTSGTVAVANATTSMVVMASPVTYPGDAIEWKAYVSAAGTVTVKVCAIVAATPTASVYNVRVIQ